MRPLLAHIRHGPNRRKNQIQPVVNASTVAVVVTGFSAATAKAGVAMITTKVPAMPPVVTKDAVMQGAATVTWDAAYVTVANEALGAWVG